LVQEYSEEEEDQEFLQNKIQYLELKAKTEFLKASLLEIKVNS